MISDSSTGLKPLRPCSLEELLLLFMVSCTMPSGSRHSSLTELCFRINVYLSYIKLDKYCYKLILMTTCL